MNKRTILSLVVAGVMLLLTLPPSRALAVFAAQQPSRTIPGAVPSEVATGRATLVGAPSGGATMSLTFALRLRDPQGLMSAVAAINNPSSPNYHRYLSQAQVNAQYGPSGDDEQQVVSWLQSNGFEVTGTYPNHLLVDARGTVGQVQQLLGLQIKQYRGRIHGKDLTFTAPDQEPTVAGSVADLIQGVVGLDSIPRVHHFSNGNANNVPAYYPQDFANAYNINPIWNAGDTGSGQHIGITLWETPPSDSTLTNWGNTTHASVPTVGNGRLKVIQVDGGTTASASGDDGEAGMDIETSGGMAPGATIDYYEAPTAKDSTGTVYPTDQGLIDSLNQAGTDSNKNQVISSSWGGCEASSITDSWTTSVENIFSTNAATGHTYVFSSGDNGSWCDPTGNGTGTDPYPDYPASSPNVLSVGGTKFNANINGGYPGESSWAYCSSCGGSPEGSGGGYSVIFSRPSWQTGSGLAANGKRGYPDISAVGDPNTGAYVCYGSSSTSCGQIGGTSLSAPMWAGMLTVLNQYVVGQGKPAIGFLDPVLYRTATGSQTAPALHDITSGTNGKYSATSAWDAVSGWGTPNLYNMAQDIAGGSTANPIPTAVPTSVLTQQLLLNPGFENGAIAAPWILSGSAAVANTLRHSGYYSARLCGTTSCNSQATQTFTVPAGVTSASLSYYVFVNMYSGCGDLMSTTVKTAGGAILTQLPTVCSSTTSPGQWVQKSQDLSAILASHPGQSLTLAFNATTGSTYGTAFYLDDASIQTTGSGGTVNTPVPLPTNTPAPNPTNTSVPVATNTSVPVATNTPVPVATNTPVPVATNTPAPVATNTSVPTAVPPASSSQQLIGNAGFENGPYNTTPWLLSPAAGGPAITYVQRHSGSYSAVLCGTRLCNQQVNQYFSVPAGVTSATLSYYVLVSTVSGCMDTLSVGVKFAGAALATPQSVCDSNTGVNTWVRKSVDVTSLVGAHPGQTLQLSLAGTTGSVTATSFYVDDVALNVTATSGAAPAPTAVPTTQPVASNTPVPVATNTPVPVATNTPVPVATNTPAPTAVPPTSGGACPGSQSGCIQAMLTLINNSRAANGLSAYTLNMTETNGTATCVGSYGHSVHMYQAGGISHDQFPGDICYPYYQAGENVGEASGTDEWSELQTIHNLMMSESPNTPATCGRTDNHACNIVSLLYHQVGIGIYYDAAHNATWLTEDFTN